jgi:hypothetical protein
LPLDLDFRPGVAFPLSFPLLLYLSAELLGSGERLRSLSRYESLCESVCRPEWPRDEDEEESLRDVDEEFWRRFESLRVDVDESLYCGAL